MRNIKLTLQFDGTAYHGWQIQKNAVTVQKVLQSAIKTLTGSNPDIVGCSRTDAGIHARKFVCNFKTQSVIPNDKFPYALNTLLPDDIRCIRSEDVAAEFDSRKSALGKTYTYLISNSQYGDVFLKDRAWHYRYKLDIEKMRRAATFLLGTHDFVGFAAAGFTVKTTVRTISAISITKEKDLISISVTGDGFLYNMVRIIAGTLVFCGNGKINPDDMSMIIQSCDRTKAGITAPACGLYLTEVFY